MICKISWGIELSGFYILMPANYKLATKTTIDICLAYLLIIAISNGCGLETKKKTCSSLTGQASKQRFRINAIEIFALCRSLSYLSFGYIYI